MRAHLRLMGKSIALSAGRNWPLESVADNFVGICAAAIDSRFYRSGSKRRHITYLEMALRSAETPESMAAMCAGR